MRDCSSGLRLEIWFIISSWFGFTQKISHDILLMCKITATHLVTE